MYERAFGFGDNGDGKSPIESGSIPQSFNSDQQLNIESTGNGSGISTGAAVGLLGILGGLALFALAIPFGIGAISGAIAAPHGRKKSAAKWGALAGGLGGMVAYPIVSGLTGSQPVARSMSSLAPIALGAYMGFREREKFSS
jgi:hypothetical protein